MDTDFQNQLRELGLGDLLDAAEKKRFQEQQDQARLERERTRRQSQADELAAIESATQTKLFALKPRYDERAKLAQAALTALSEFCQVETKLHDDIDAIATEFADTLCARGVFDTDKRLSEITRRAGLGSHEGFGLPGVRSESEKTALVAIKLIVLRFIVGGVIKKISQELRLC